MLFEKVNNKDIVKVTSIYTLDTHDTGYAEYIILTISFVIENQFFGFPSWPDTSPNADR